MAARELRPPFAKNQLAVKTIYMLNCPAYSDLKKYLMTLKKYLIQSDTENKMYMLTFREIQKTLPRANEKFCWKGINWIYYKKINWGDGQPWGSHPSKHYRKSTSSDKHHKNNKKFVTLILNTTTGKYGPCYTTWLLGCQHFQTTKKFRSVQTSGTFKKISPSHLQEQLCHLLIRISHLPNSGFQKIWTFNIDQ